MTIGADDYGTKPFNVEILILRMRKLIDLSKKRKMCIRDSPCIGLFCAFLLMWVRRGLAGFSSYGPSISLSLIHI